MYIFIRKHKGVCFQLHSFSHSRWGMYVAVIVGKAIDIFGQRKSLLRAFFKSCTLLHRHKMFVLNYRETTEYTLAGQCKYQISRE